MLWEDSVHRPPSRSPNNPKTSVSGFKDLLYIPTARYCLKGRQTSLFQTSILQAIETYSHFITIPPKELVEKLHHPCVGIVATLDCFRHWINRLGRLLRCFSHGSRYFPVNSWKVAIKDEKNNSDLFLSIMVSSIRMSCYGCGS